MTLKQDIDNVIAKITSEDFVSIDFQEVVYLLEILKNKIYCVNCGREHSFSCTLCTIEEKIQQLKMKLRDSLLDLEK